MKHLIRLVFLALLIVGVLGGCTKDSKPVEDAQKSTPSAMSSPEAQQAPGGAAIAGPSAGNSAAATTAAASNNAATADLTADATTGLSKAIVVMKTSRGTIKFKLYPKDAPNTVKRFVELVQSKFYNGLLFHRVVPGFVVQAGDPKSRNKNEKEVGTGGSGMKLKAEFNSRKHERGTVSMARAADPDSADSQFYLTMGSFPHLDNNYTVFGKVVDFGEKQGDQDVLDRIRQWDEIVDMHVE